MGEVDRQIGFLGKSECVLPIIFGEGVGVAQLGFGISYEG